MIIDNQTPLYTSEEIDLIKSYWNEETSEKEFLKIGVIHLMFCMIYLKNIQIDF